MSSNVQVVPQDLLRKRVQRIEERFEFLRTLLSVLIALVIVLAIVAIVSDEPLKGISTLLTGPLTSMRRFGNVIELMIPLTFTGLALTIVFKSNRFNLAADSAFYFGSMAACMIGIFSKLPAPLTILLALVAGTVAGAIIGYIPAMIGQFFGANVLVISLMLNYIIGFVVKYLFSYVVRDPNMANQQSLPLPNNVNLGRLVPGTRIHYGLIIVLVLVALAYIILYKTKWGYALRTTGANEKFAKYSGIKVPVVVLLAQVIGTALAGLGGSVEMLGIYKVFLWVETPALGFDGVIIATLAKMNPKNVPLAAFFLAYIRIGADILNRTSDIPAEVVSIVQATIILLIAAKAFLVQWKEKEIVKASEMLAEAKKEVAA
ncbi:MAG: ABC transporter permease [Anaerolineaceae bacterium]|nr:ABC transporter permease [Anaerolineaceae bacterium]